ncbi:Crp/Fnr family transcriptional regulator [Spongiimicrobium sp. 3-5]|uniref:Crp/Fnr family transcriptional regulator n=1 Tax=Spongiimicrobium sp. 3-5 TaxID=3332596 RepID=UPI00397FAD4E
MNSHLSAYIRRYIDLTEEEDALFQSYLTPATLKKKEYVLQQGETCKSRYFISQGCIRLYYIDQKGSEQIVHFGVEHWWITDYDSLLSQTPSHLNIQAIEKTELLELKETALIQLYAKIPALERLFRVIMERTYVACQRRLEYMFSLNSEQMYETFITSNPQFAQRIPQYMLASYLGITPEYLSTLRKLH